MKAAKTTTSVVSLGGQQINLRRAVHGRFILLISRCLQADTC